MWYDSQIRFQGALALVQFQILWTDDDYFSKLALVIVIPFKIYIFLGSNGF